MDSEISDLNDIEKLSNALGGDKDNESPTPDILVRCDSAADEDSMASSYQQHLTPQTGDGSFCIFEELDESPDEYQLVVDELPPNLENVLNMNQVYQEVLFELTQQLEVLRISNQQKQRSALEELEELQLQASIRTKKKKKKKITFSFFGMPYFKDADYNTAPKNEDTLLAENIGFRNISLFNMFKPLSKIEIRKLRRGLKDQAIALEAKRLMELREKLQLRLKTYVVSSPEEDQRKEIEAEIQSVQRQIYNVNNSPEDKILDIPPDEFDWKKIAIIDFRRARTPDQLRLYWMHHIRPGVNRRPWTAAENRNLKEIVKSWDCGIPWDEVAERLGTNRTPFDCFRRYQERLNEQHRKFGWSVKDNLKLIQLLKNYSNKTMNEIDWEEVRLHFPGRSKSQIYAHFRYHTSLSDSTPFTPNEDVVILEGVKMGYDLSDITLLLGKRTLGQVRYRYRAIQKLNKGMDKNWTEKENSMLLAMESACELKRHVIKKQFPGRSFAQLFSRYHFLRMKSTTPQKYIEELKDKARTSRRSLLPHDNKIKAKQIMDMITNMGTCDSRDRRMKVSVKKKIPVLRRDLLGDEIPSRIDPRMTVGRPLRIKKSIACKEKELKEILRPLMSTNTKRPRICSFPGDGREHGIILACLYRLLYCNFTLAPTGDLTEEDVEELGIPQQHTLAFINLLSLTKDLPQTEFIPSYDNFLCLPPTLNLLTGFRGLLLHRKYLQTSAANDYVMPTRATIVEVPDDPPSVNSTETEVTPSVAVPAIETSQVATSSSVAIREAAPITEPTQPEPPRVLVLPIEGAHEDIGHPAVGLQSQEPPRAGLLVDVPANESLNPLNMEDTIMDEESAMEQTQDEVENPSEASTEAEDEEEQEEEEVEEEEEESSPREYFGDPKADSILLSRLISLFYWPGVMSAVKVPKSVQESTEPKPPEKDPLSLDDSLLTPSKATPPKNTKLTKKEMKERRRKNIQSIVRRRYGKPDPVEGENPEQPTPSTSAAAEPGETVEAERTPPAKKPRKAPRRKNVTPSVPITQRVSRPRRANRSATYGS